MTLTAGGLSPKRIGDDPVHFRSRGDFLITFPRNVVCGVADAEHRIEQKAVPSRSARDNRSVVPRSCLRTGLWPPSAPFQRLENQCNRQPRTARSSARRFKRRALIGCAGPQGGTGFMLPPRAGKVATVFPFNAAISKRGKPAVRHGDIQ